MDGTGGADLELVRDHVTKTLIVDNTKINISPQFLPRYATVHRFTAVVIESSQTKLLPKVIHRRVLLIKLEGSGVLGYAVNGTRLGCHALHKHANGHATGKGMRVDDDVRGESALGEGHVNQGPFLRAHALLTVSGGELVTDDGIAGDPETSH